MVTGQYDTVLIPPMCLVEDKTWLISEYTTHGRLFKSRSSGSTQLPYRRHDPVTISCLSRAPMLELITLISTCCVVGFNRISTGLISKSLAKSWINLERSP